MKKILKVLLDDLKNLFKNPIALIVVLGLCILPSLYAWINIYACWDPYANTNNLPVVVVNKDMGITWKGMYINAGEEIIKNLEENNSVGWVFEEEWEAHYGLNEGKYYALIEIPVDFSSDLVSITSTNPIKPQVIYKANEKSNAIATKITHVVVTKLEDEIKSAFIEMVYKVALEKLNTGATYLKDNKDKMLGIQGTLDEVNSNLGDVEQYIDGAHTQSTAFIDYIESVKESLPHIEESIRSLQELTQSSKAFNQSTTQNITMLRKALENNLEELLGTSEEIQDALEDLKLDPENNTSLKELSLIKSAYEKNIRIIEFKLGLLNVLNNWHSNRLLINLIEKLEQIEIQMKDAHRIVGELIEAINEGDPTDTLNAHLDICKVEAKEIGEAIDEVARLFMKQGTGSLEDTFANLNSSDALMDVLLEDTKAIGSKLTTLAEFLVATNELTSSQAQSLLTPLQVVNDKLSEIGDKTEYVTEENLNTMIELMSKDPEEISAFLGAPLEIVQEDVYQSVTFGVGLTPFYSVLAIWIGALLACCLLSVSVDEERRRDQRLTERSMHLGKLLLFYMISSIQALIIIVGDVYLLGVKPDNLPLLIGFTLLTSISFTTIIFTLVCKLGNIGKAIAVVMMVFQIAGSGGIYPIETNPEIFSILAPLWPFTYAMGGLREAIAGPIRHDVVENFVKLVGFFGVFFMVLLIHTPIHQWMMKFDENFKQSMES